MVSLCRWSLNTVVLRTGSTAFITCKDYKASAWRGGQTKEMGQIQWIKVQICGIWMVISLEVILGMCTQGLTSTCVRICKEFTAQHRNIWGNICTEGNAAYKHMDIWQAFINLKAKHATRHKIFYCPFNSCTIAHIIRLVTNWHGVQKLCS